MCSARGDRDASIVRSVRRFQAAWCVDYPGGLQVLGVAVDTLLVARGMPCTALSDS